MSGFETFPPFISMGKNAWKMLNISESMKGMNKKRYSNRFLIKLNLSNFERSFYIENWEKIQAKKSGGIIIIEINM